MHIDTTILSVAGAGPDEGYLGLQGIETGNEDDAPAIRTPGRAERVRLQPDDTLRTTHDSGIHTDVSANFWITRSAYRLLYAHDGLAAWKPNGFDYQSIRPVAVPGLGAPVDIAAHPDGTLYLADREKLLRFHPDTGAAEQIPLPGSDLRRLYLDARARPPALYVSTGDGLFVLRPRSPRGARYFTRSTVIIPPSACGRM